MYEAYDYKCTYFYLFIPLFASLKGWQNLSFFTCKASPYEFKVKHQRKAAYKQLFSDA